MRSDLLRILHARLGRRPGRACAVGLLLVMTAAVAPPARFRVDAGSRFWIDGTSTMGRYTCRAARLNGSGTAETTAPLRGRAELQVEARSFDCGQPQMNRDFVRALRADAHPRITLAVDRVDVRPAQGEALPVTASGTLRLAGVERPVTFRATAHRLPDGRVRIEGQHALRMTDFGVTPPTGLMGLVRAHDRVTARFDVVVREE